MFLHALVCCMCVSVGDFCEIYHPASGSINAECLHVCVCAEVCMCDLELLFLLLQCKPLCNICRLFV